MTHWGGISKVLNARDPATETLVDAPRSGMRHGDVPWHAAAVRHGADDLRRRQVPQRVTSGSARLALC